MDISVDLSVGIYVHGKPVHTAYACKRVSVAARKPTRLNIEFDLFGIVAQLRHLLVVLQLNFGHSLFERITQLFTDRQTVERVTSRRECIDYCNAVRVGPPASSLAPRHEYRMQPTSTHHACVEATAVVAGQVESLVQASDTDSSLSTSLLSGVADGHRHY